MRSSIFLVLVASLAWPALAKAQDKPAEAPAPLPNAAYLSLSPLHLTRPIAELTGEMRIGLRSSVALIMGAGTIWRRTFWNAGTQLLFYPVGDFDRGMQLGIETSYARMPGGMEPNQLIGPVNAITFSPLIGFKWTFTGGFTISSQAGASYAPGAESDRRFSALYNLNVGWSF